MDRVKCVNCGSEENKEQAKEKGWLMKPKACGPPGNLFVLCSHCLFLGNPATAYEVKGVGLRVIDDYN